MVNSLLILLVSLLSLGSLAAGENAHWAYRPVVDAWQPNTNEHVVIPLNTNYKTHECGGFCTFRGTNFGSEKCVAFYVNITDCHLVKFSGEKSPSTAPGYTYYIKEVQQLI